MRLTCTIAGADFVSKLVPMDAAAKAAAKKRPKAADLNEEPDSKKPKKAKAKSTKPKPPAAPKIKPENEITLESKESINALQSDVGFSQLFGRGEVESSRPRRWMDDLISALEKAHGKQLDPLEDHLTSKTATVGSLISMGLEFALTGKLTIEKKTFKDWSKARPMLQTVLFRFMKKYRETAGSGVGQSLTDVANKLLSTISASASNPLVQAQDSMEAVVRKVLDSKRNMESAKQWVARNNTDKIVNEPAYNEFYKDLLITIGCTCGDESWDAEPCQFHESCEHSIRDMVWGIIETMEVEFSGRPEPILPISVPLLGTAAMAGRRVFTSKQAEATAAAASDPDAKTDCPKDLAEFIGKDADFLLQVDQVSKEKVLNEKLLALMISSKARYLLHAFSTVMHSPGAGASKSRVAHFSDVPRPAALVSLLEWLCSEKGVPYLMEIETRFQFLVQSTAADLSPGENWGTVWATILSQALSKEAAEVAKQAEGKGESLASVSVEAIDWKKFLPASTKVVKGTSLMASPSPETGDSTEVKDEKAAEAAATSASTTGDGKVTLGEHLDGYLSFHDVYDMHDLGTDKSLNAMDVIGIGLQIQANILAKAASSNSSAAAKELLKALIMDPKNPGQCVLHLPSLSVKDGDDPRKLWVFGTVSTESGPKSIKVASATFDGDLKIDYYITADGWSKATSPVPCAGWMCKSGLAEDKALFKGFSEDEQLELVDVHGYKRTVMIHRLGIELRTAAIRIIEKKGTSEVVCTRSAFPREEPPAKVGVKKAAKQCLALGGSALASKGKGKGKAKVEENGAGSSNVAGGDESAWQWLFRTTPNKCAAHLMR